MFTYPRVLRPKDLKKISKYPCDDQIKDAVHGFAVGKI